MTTNIRMSIDRGAQSSDNNQPALNRIE
jgi:hypothetical protein